MISEEREEHLGGYIPGGDAATYYPDLWEWLVKDLHILTVLDVGCGDGVAIDYFQGIGASALGIEGTAQNHPGIVQHDFTKGPWDPRRATLPLGVGMVWCCEFLEHIEARYIPNVLPLFLLADLVLLTHAFPGQDGYHHVNCQLPVYWKGVMAGVGYEVDEELTARTRDLAALNGSPWNHFVRSGLAFRRVK